MIVPINFSSILSDFGLGACYDGKEAMIEDAELLRRYARDRSEAAFAELAKRRLDLVYSVALRQVGGDMHLAQDVTQRVFADLARKARELADRTVLSGWLYRSAQFAAADVVRSERRRREREQETQTMHETSSDRAGEADWEKFRPVLDQVLGELDDEDRDAVALRFFEERSFADVGRALRLSEDTARKRVARALDKMHALLARRGVTSTTAAVAVALANQVTVAAPTGLAATVTGAALAGSAAGAGGWLITFMSISKLQVGIAGVLAMAGATGYFLQTETNASLRREIAALRGQQAEIASLRGENQRLASTAAEVEMLRRDDLEFKQLEESAAEIKKSNEENARMARARDNDQSVQAEIDRLNREGTALVEEYKALIAQSKDPSLPVEARADASVAAQRKIEAIKMKAAEITSFKESARATGWVPPPVTWTIEPRRSAPNGDGSSNNAPQSSADGTLTFRPSAPARGEPASPSSSSSPADGASDSSR